MLLVDQNLRYKHRILTIEIHYHQKQHVVFVQHRFRDPEIKQYESNDRKKESILDWGYYMIEMLVH